MNFYRGVVLTLITDRLTELGWDKSDLFSDAFPAPIDKQSLHDWLKAQFRITSLEDYSDVQFGRYVNRVVDWAARDLDLYIKPL